MGSWGMEALESDEGLDLINWVEEQLKMIRPLMPSQLFNA